ncbi:hypothetical protein Tco_1111997 [Tanacetum coccineum]|uniref:Integrase catalytic domain-containing protein n=1 Tax=Tanacetum coccineum TaxID=301880 RepID=A0ABQ5IN65_9ASTR
MSRDVITVCLTMRIPLLYRGEYSQWHERFMNYLEEQTDGEAMINSIQNGDHPLPVIAQIDRLARSLLIQGLPNDIYSLSDSNDTAKDLWDALERQMRGSEYGEQDRKTAILYEYETFRATEGEQLLDTYLRYLQVINDLKKCSYKKDNCELNYKFLNNLQPEWKQYGTLMRQTKNLIDINIDALYNILKQNQGNVNDAMGYKMKAVVVTSDLLALVAEKTKVIKRKEKVVVQSESEGSDDEDISDLKKITALLAKAFNRKKYYAKPTNNNLRISSASSSVNKKPKYVKSEEKKEDKKADEKKRDMSKVKCYNYSEESHHLQKKPLNRSNSNKSLPRTVFRWLPKMQPLAEPVAKWIPKVTTMGDVVIGSMTIKKVYYVEGLGHNLFSVGQFCDKGLEVAFRKSTCFVRNEDGVDLLTGDRSSNLYTIALNEIASNSSACLLAKASSSQSWLWHQRLSHLNFATINNPCKTISSSLPKNKFEKDHLFPSCEQGNSSKQHKSKTSFASNRSTLSLNGIVWSDRVESINGKAIDEASEVIISFIKKTQVNLQLQVQRVRTDNGTEFKNKTLAKFFDEVGISQQFSAARTPQQNGVVERRNRTLVEAARTMLTFANLPLFLWAEAIATACFTQNRLIIHKRFDKTPYELYNERKPNIKFFHVFGCRCYLLNDYDDVGKLKAKGDIGVFVGYSKESAAFRIYNKRTRKIHESVNVNFDEISEMASKQFSLEPGLSNLNETGKSSNPTVSQVSEISKKDLEDLFYNFYDEYFDSSKITKSSTTNVETSNNEISSHEGEVFHEVSESFQEESSSSSLNDDVQQSSEEVMVSPTNTQSISNNMVPNVNEASSSHNVFNERLEDAYFDASTTFHDPSNVHTFYQPYPHEKKWTKDHPLHKIIGDPKSSVRTRGQLANSCLFACLLSSIEPANIAEALKDADWVSAMQDELDQFPRLKV